MKHFSKQSVCLIFIFSITTLVLAHTWEATKEAPTRIPETNPITIFDAGVSTGIMNMG